MDPIAPPHLEATAGSVRFQAIVARIAVHAAAIFFAILFFLPFWWMVTTALKDLPEATRNPPTWFPTKIHWENFGEATGRIPFWLFTWNTLKICILNVIGTTLSSALVAWGFACYRFPGRSGFFAITLATMMVPFPVLMVPQYAMFRAMGWTGTSLPLWAPSFFGVAYNIFLLRQFFMGLPRDLVEAARIDGCGEFRIFLSIVLPLSRSVLVVVALFCFLYHWNDFMGPLIYLTDESQFTLALGLQSFQSRLGGVELHLMMAVTTLMILPIVVLFFLGQRYIIEGISLSGTKA